MGLTIIIPIKVSSLHYLDGFAECYRALLQSEELKGKLQIIIVDDSQEEIYSVVDHYFSSDDVIHFRPPREYMTGRNNKMNSVHAAMQYVAHQYTLLLDDDYRPSCVAICGFIKNMEEKSCSCMKSMVTFKVFTLTDMIYCCGIFIMNLLDRYREFCGHLGFKTDDLREIGFPHKDGLFDELTFELHFHRAGKTVCYADDVFLEKVTHGTKKFLEQRVRYTYEQQAFPLRFTMYLLIFPLVILSAAWGTPYISAAIIAFFTLGSWAVALLGQLRYGQGRFPWLAWTLGPAWFWPFPLTAWLAVMYRFAGGYWWGGQRVKDPV